METLFFNSVVALIMLLPLEVNPIRRIIAVLKLPRSINGILAKAEAIVGSMTGNAYFVTPPFPLTDITALVTQIRAKQVEVTQRKPGAKDERNTMLFQLRLMLFEITAYVQGVADEDIANCEAIILSAGLHVKRITIPNRGGFTAKNTSISGQVRLRAPGFRGTGSHEWQMGSTAETFTSLPSTTRCTTLVDGLTPQSKVYFRHREVRPGGNGPWSVVINLIIT